MCCCLHVLLFKCQQKVSQKRATIPKIARVTVQVALQKIPFKIT